MQRKYPLERRVNMREYHRRDTQSIKMTANLYYRFAMGYSQRRLTKPADGLHALSGLIKLMEERLNSRSFFDFPECIFDNPVAWSWFNHHPELQRDCFSTWSWISWMNPKGPEKNYPLPLNRPDDPAESIVDWYRLDTSDLSCLKWVAINNTEMIKDYSFRGSLDSYGEHFIREQLLIGLNADSFLLAYV